jgi:hypothetical protein
MKPTSSVKLATLLKLCKNGCPVTAESLKQKQRLSSKDKHNAAQG